ncbi:MAG: D-alanyl-D-alanine carboxypeptidase/D-alanyl-D-alanine-endopeptidase [Armatimonadetes bacterium]|nr:D-alanyl-D-alanine carboxypeptidase/D-alanyl-D-alanine-endopeptidase [Armatimonadota bacterium]
MVALLALCVIQSGTAPLDAILNDERLATATVGAYVADISGKVLYERNSRKLLMPASNQKLLSTAFAFKVLGPDYRPVTRFWKLEDRIVVDAPGDPMMSAQQLRDAATKLKIEGRLPVFAKQAFKPIIPPTWETDDLPFAYAARISALMVDRGLFRVYGERGELKVEPKEFVTRLLNVPWSNRIQPRVSYDPDLNRVKVEGGFPDDKTLLGTFAVPQPDRLAAAILAGPLYETEELPRRAPDLTIQGETIAKMVAECLPPSDNTIAECLLLMAAAKTRVDPDMPYLLAGGLMRDFLVKDVGIDLLQVRSQDGSGMSRHNLVSAEALGKLLLWMQNQPFGKVWRESLPKPGEGTLRNRLKGASFQGKTGTLDAVSALSGYLKLKDGRTLVVSLLMNHYLCPSSEARAIQDRFVQALEGFGRTGTRFDGAERYENPRPSSLARDLDGSGVHGFGGHGGALRTRLDRRAQPTHASPAGAGNVGLRRR